MPKVSGRVLRKMLCAQLMHRARSSSHSKKSIYLTFDDGPHDTHTSPLLRLLKQYDATATFFVIGELLPKRESVILEIIDDGHLLGNHTFSHQVLPFISRNRLPDEVMRCQDLIERFQPGSRRLFRPPEGLIGVRDLLFLKSNGFTPCLWTHDSKDHLKESAPELLAERLMKADEGAVILFHDDGDLCMDVLRKLLPYWQSKGYRFKSMSAFWEP